MDALSLYSNPCAGPPEPPEELFRSACQGLMPLRGRLEPWMADLFAGRNLHDWVERFESPLNVLELTPLERNLHKLQTVARQRELDMQIYFARKANKCLSVVDRVLALGAGIDTASQIELSQVLERGFPPQRVICTAAIKTPRLLAECVTHGVTVVVDNEDELQALAQLAIASRCRTTVAIRVGGFRCGGDKLHTRFGIDIDHLLELVDRFWAAADKSPLILAGLHFHLDGGSVEQRVAAISQLLPIIDQLRFRGHAVTFLDIGGGFPMNYLESQQEWDRFWTEQQRAECGQREEITFRNHRIANTFPYFQSLVQADWLARILDTHFAGESIAESLRRRAVQLRCEPGRSLLDGCGLTVARVEFRKQHPDGYWLIGLSMNRTQCRTTHEDYLVDPLLVPHPDRRQIAPAAPLEGYLVGAYCTECELLSLRRLRFPQGVARGDLVVFPNTAGYLMHFMESRSHQFPLAKNGFVDLDRPAELTLDEL